MKKQLFSLLSAAILFSCSPPNQQVAATQYADAPDIEDLQKDTNIQYLGMVEHLFSFSQNPASDQEKQANSISDFERKETYEFNIIYSTDSGVFSNQISLNIIDDLVDNTLHLNDISISTASKAQEAVMVLDKALIQVNEFQAYIGSIQNRLSSSLELTYVNLENASKSRGRIIDADFAAETQVMATQQILMQSAQSVLAQANNAKQNILTLIG